MKYPEFLSQYRDCALSWATGDSVPARSNGGIFFLFSTASEPLLGFIQPPIQWVPAVISEIIKLLAREADHLPPSSAGVKNSWSCTSQYVMSWCLVKQDIRLHDMVLSKAW